MIAAKNRAHLRRGQHHHYREFTPECSASSGVRPPPRQAREREARLFRYARLRGPFRPLRPQDQPAGRGRSGRNNAAPSMFSMRSASPGGIATGRRAERAKSRRAIALSRTSRRGVSHKPRPGSRAATSGTSSPLGCTTNRSSLDRSPIVPVAMQRRSGPAAAPPALSPIPLILSRALVTPTPAG